MTVLSTAEREAMERAWDSLPPKQGAGARTRFGQGWEGARDFYGPERVAELERELEGGRTK